jgi:CRP-like cAMP-binding protein
MHSIGTDKLKTLTKKETNTFDPKKLMHDVIPILNSQINKRSQEDVQTLSPLLKNLPLIKNNEFIQQTGKEDLIVEDLCQILTLKTHTEGQIVFRYGDYGNHFYIIIEGTVSVHVPILKEIDANEEDIDNEKHQVKRILTEVSRLEAPNSFGDVALIDYKPRTATIKCVTNWVFALIDKANYQKIIGRVTKKNIGKIIDLFRSIPYFTHWKINEIKKFKEYFTEVEYLRNHTVYKEGAHPEFVYIVKTGDFEIIKKVKHRLNSNDKYYDIMFDKKDYVPRNDFRWASPVLGFSMSGNKVNSQYVRWAQIGKGSIIGEHEVVHKTPWAATVKCFSTTGSLLRIPAFDFMRMIKQLNPYTLKLLDNSEEGVFEQVNHYLKNNREINFMSKMMIQNEENEENISLIDQIIERHHLDIPLSVLNKSNWSCQKQTIDDYSSDTYSPLNLLK